MKRKHELVVKQRCTEVFIEISKEGENAVGKNASWETSDGFLYPSQHESWHRLCLSPKKVRNVDLGLSLVGRSYDRPVTCLAPEALSKSRLRTE